MNRWLITLTLLGLLSSTAVAEWEYAENEGWIEARSGRKGTANQVLQDSRRSLKSDPGAAARQAALVAQFGASRASQADALLILAEAQILGNEMEEAYETYVLFLRYHPRDKRLNGVVEDVFKLGEKMATDGTAHDVLGVPVANSPWAGIQVLQDTLQQHPFHPNSDIYHFKLANIFFAMERWEEAKAAYTILLENYPQSKWLEPALYQIAETYLHTWNGIEYDPTPLRQAREKFLRFIERFPTSARADEAIARARFCEEALAEKEYRVAHFYIHRGQTESGRFTLRRLKAKYPDTSWARKATGELGDETP